MKVRTLPRMGRILSGKILKLIRIALETRWSGVIRIRNQGQIGALWFVRGELSHAVTVTGQRGKRGISAVVKIMDWANGSYFRDDNVLPPDRTIRVPTEDLLRLLLDSGTERVGYQLESRVSNDMDLTAVLNRLRTHSPEICGIGLADDHGMKQLSPCKEDERRWIEDRVRLMMGEVGDSEILVRERERSVLLIKRKNRVAVVFAGSNATSENMLWAGEQTRQLVLEPTNERAESES